MRWSGTSSKRSEERLRLSFTGLSWECDGVVVEGDIGKSAGGVEGGVEGGVIAVGDGVKGIVASGESDLSVVVDCSSSSGVISIGISDVKNELVSLCGVRGGVGGVVDIDSVEASLCSRLACNCCCLYLPP